MGTAVLCCLVVWVLFVWFLLFVWFGFFLGESRFAPLHKALAIYPFIRIILLGW